MRTSQSVNLQLHNRIVDSIAVFKIVSGSSRAEQIQQIVTSLDDGHDVGNVDIKYSNARDIV